MKTVFLSLIILLIYSCEPNRSVVMHENVNCECIIIERTIHTSEGLIYEIEYLDYSNNETEITKTSKEKIEEYVNLYQEYCFKNH